MATADAHDDNRLSRIATEWSVLRDAHAGATLKRSNAQEALLELYAGPVFRYLLGAVRDEETAEELCHEFAVRFLQGDFHRVTPGKKRFRDYVRKVLINLVNDYHRSRVHRPQLASPSRFDGVSPGNDPEEETTFDSLLQEEILNSTWSALEQLNRRYHAVLLLRSQNPDHSSRELAVQLGASLNEDVSPVSVRKNLERARLKFADLLVEQANNTLHCGSTEQLRRELKDLGLLGYGESALERRP
jgi:RNA polymerase sigma factor (sigma-70 family)